MKTITKKSREPEIEAKNIICNLNETALIEEAVKRSEGVFSATGALMVETGKHTARSAKDKFIVREKTSQKNIWWGDYNVPIEESRFDNLLSKMLHYMKQKDIFIRDCFAGTDRKNRLPVRIITQHAWQSLFSTYLFIPAKGKEAENFKPGFTIIALPEFTADPDIDGTRSSTFIIVNFRKRTVIIGGTAYAGEIKKSVFSVMNYLLPLKGIFPMHCSANIGKKNDTAVFFGLSGTGKTTLSSDPERRLIGDDQHGWSDDGIFNFEGGCYAKVINLSKEAEPQIHAAVNSFGALLENTVYDKETRIINFADNSLTENTRGAYPIRYIDNYAEGNIFPHPKNIVMLTYDAFGVLPPVSKLTYEQAMYHFLSGYTAKVANTEMGIKEPKATFSTCFGAPFMSHHPMVYAKMLGERIRKHKAECWLINTGLTGGPYGTGKRISIKATREILNLAIEGKLSKAAFEKEKVFGLLIPQKAGDVPKKILNPWKSWPRKDEYDKKIAELAKLFTDNFNKFGIKAKDILAAAPKI